VKFYGFFECISNLFENFLSVWPIVDFLWVMILDDLWNSWCLLDGPEILWSDSRHINIYHGFGLSHLSCVDSVLCLCEVDVWNCASFELVCAYLVLWILFDMLPFVQMTWILVWWSCDECCLAMIFLGIYWVIFELMWIGSFCLLQWALDLHDLP